MRIGFLGSSLLSSYWNGAATYYRGLLRALAAYGHDITFYEPDAYDRQSHRDIEPPPWCRSVVYAPDPTGVTSVLGALASADVVIKASGVGVNDDALLAGMRTAARPDAVRIFWDVDAPATLAEIGADVTHPVRGTLPWLDLVLTYGGGAPVVDAYRALGARRCVPIYNALDPATHYPVAPDARYRADLSFIGNRLSDREARVDTFFLAAAAAMPSLKFLLGGAGWDDRACPPNVRKLGHVPTNAHNAVNASGRAILNISRARMAAMGFSPATRLFEVAGAGGCLLTDAWEGIGQFLQPGEEVLVVRDTVDVVEALRTLTPWRAAAIGAAALRRVRADHTYDHRAATVHAVLTAALVARRTAGAV